MNNLKPLRAEDLERHFPPAAAATRQQEAASVGRKSSVADGSADSIVTETAAGHSLSQGRRTCAADSGLL